MKTLIEKLKVLRLYFVSKRYTKSWNEMTLIEQWQYARNNFLHYAIRYIYDYGDYYRRTVTSEEKQYCFEQANYWENKYKELADKIREQPNVC